MSKNYYEVFGISKDATLKEIKQAYLKKCKEFHPDNNPFENATIAHTMMCLLNDAYSTLRDPEKRMEYDSLLEEQEKSEVNKNVNNTQSYNKPNNSNLRKSFYNYKKYNEDDFDDDEQECFISYNIEFMETFIRYYYNKVKNIKEKDNLLDLYLKLYNFIDIEKEYYNIYSISKTQKRNLFK